MCLRTTDDREVRSELFIGSLGVGGGKMAILQRKANVELPGDVGPLGFTPFQGDRKGHGARKIAV
jgi:hypothetical protein